MISTGTRDRSARIRCSAGTLADPPHRYMRDSVASELAARKKSSVRCSLPAIPSATSFMIASTPAGTPSEAPALSAILNASASSWLTWMRFWISSVNASPPTVTSRVKMLAPSVMMLMLEIAAPMLISATDSPAAAS